MTHIDTGHRGAKVQSWAQANPRDVLKRLVDEHPTWGKDRLLKALHEKVINNERLIETIIEYWFTNNYHSLIPVERPRASPVEKQTAVSVARGKIQRRIAQEAQVLLLELMMPNGKNLRDCTGQECESLATKMGGWLLRVSKRIGPNKTVGEVLNEDQLRELYAKTMSR